jgi:hypothetical protein
MTAQFNLSLLSRVAPTLTNESIKSSGKQARAREILRKDAVLQFRLSAHLVFPQVFLEDENH